MLTILYARYRQIFATRYKRSSPANDDDDNVQSSKKVILEQEGTSDGNKAGKATSDSLDRVSTNGGILLWTWRNNSSLRTTGMSRAWSCSWSTATIAAAAVINYKLNQILFDDWEVALTEPKRERQLR